MIYLFGKGGKNARPQALTIISHRLTINFYWWWLNDLVDFLRWDIVTAWYWSVVSTKEI